MALIEQPYTDRMGVRHLQRVLVFRTGVVSETVLVLLDRLVRHIH